MYIVETIHIRSFSDSDRQKAVELFNSLSLKGKNIPEKIKLFRHGNMSGDLNIALYWKKDCTFLKASDFSQNLVAALKYFGWISHSLWTPVKEKTSC